jgi:hypothetical protein
MAFVGLAWRYFIKKYGTWVIRCVITWHYCAWHGQGYVYPAPLPLPPDWVIHACRPFGINGIDLDRPYINKIISVTILSKNFKLNLNLNFKIILN